MGTLTGTRATSTFPMGGFGEAANLKVAWGSYTLATNPTQGDIIEFCWLPKGARILGGWLQGKDVDTGTEALDIDIGLAANGVDAADTDALLNSGVISGDAITDLRPEAGIFYPFGGLLLDTGPIKVGADTKVIGTVNAAANAGGTGILTVVVLYTIDYS